MEKSIRPGRRPWLVCGLVAIALLVALNLALFAARSAIRYSNGFIAYYTSSQLLGEGVPVQDFYDDNWFAARIAELGPAIYDTFAPNPPTTALLMVPLAGLDQLDARLIWTLLSLVVLLGSVAWILAKTGMRRTWALGFIILVLLYQPVYSSLYQGQVYLLLLGVLVVAWQGFRSDRPAILGIALGIMLSLKTAGMFLWLLPLVRRKWSTLAWGVGTVLAVVAGTLPLLGHESWQTYLGLLPSFSNKPDQAVVAYQTLPGLLRHLLTYDAQWNPSPLATAPLAATGLGLLCAGAMLGTGCLVAWRSRERDAVFSAFVIATLVLSPLSLDYHYPLALLPLGMLWARVSTRPGLWPVLILALATALLALDLPYLSPRLAGGAWSLLAYPKLYGALILWGLAIWVAHRKR